MTLTQMTGAGDRFSYRDSAVRVEEPHPGLFEGEPVNMPMHEDDTKRADRDQHDALLEDARVELEAAAEDVEDLNKQLRDRTRDVQRLEVLVDRLLELVEVPTIVVEPDGHVAAMSRGAAEHHPHLSRDAVGRSVSAVLPESLADDILRLVEVESSTNTAASTRSDSSGPPHEEGHRLSGATAFALPDGSIVVQLDRVDASGAREE